MSDYFIATWRQTLRRGVAARAQREIHAFDPSIDLVANLSIPGNQLRMWLVRPNDGTNDYIDQRRDNRRAKDIVEKCLHES